MLVVLCLSVFSCKTEDIWQYDIQSIKEKLKNSDFNFLYLIDFDNYSSSEILKLGEEAPFYFYYIFKSLGLNIRALEMLDLLHKKSTGLYAEEAVLILFETHLENEEYKELEQKSFDFLLRVPDTPIKFTVLNYYVKALYWQEKDKQVISTIENIFNELKIDIDTFNKINNTCTELSYYEIAELILLKAVSSARTNTDNWETLFENLYINQSVSELHVRAYQYLTLIEPNKIFSFDDDIQELFKGKYFLSIGDRNSGIESLKSALETLNPDKFKYSPILKELGFAFLNSSEIADGALFMDQLSDKYSGNKKLEIIEMAGRIYNKQEDYENAYERLNSVISESSDSLQRDRCYWFILDIKLNESAASAMKEVILNAQNWTDLEYFEDQIHHVITGFLKTSDFENLKFFYDFFKQNYSRPLNFLIRAEYILLRNGYLDISEIPLDYYSGIIKPYMTIELYYFLLISYYNKTLKANIYKIINPVDFRDNKEKDTADTQYDVFIKGFQDYGIPEYSFDYIVKYIDHLNINTLFDLSKVLNEYEHYRESIGLISSYFARRQILPNNRELLISYPNAFSEEINELSKRDNLEAPVIYGIIRSESVFNMGISSYAGAIGLMQLMPDTAAEMAELIGIAEIDLTNPYQNLALGTKYIEYLNSRFDTLSKTVIAYNAGPGNMRKWESSFYGYSSDLLTEVIPFVNTKHYVKKVIISSVIYAVLYRFNEPEDILLMFYPDL